jgi:hypothetical protein
MPKKTLPQSPLEKRYNLTDPKPQFPLETFKMILRVGLKEGVYPCLWRDRKPNIQQFMRILHPTCEMCGKDSSGFSLDVHHLYWHKKHDCTYDNLFVVCRGCHVRLHRRGDGWFPSKPWAIADWGNVPQGLIDRNHLDKDGNAIAPQIVDNNKKSKTDESERKSKTTKSSRKAATVSAQE